MESSFTMIFRKKIFMSLNFEFKKSVANSKLDVKLISVGELIAIGTWEKEFNHYAKEKCPE